MTTPAQPTRNVVLAVAVLAIAVVIPWAVAEATQASPDLSGERIALNSDIRSDLLAWWNFEDGAGNVLSDMSGNGHDGTIVGATWIVDGGVQALSFDGSDDYVDLSLAPQYETTDDFTWEVVCRFTEPAVGIKRAMLGLEKTNNAEVKICHLDNASLGCDVFAASRGDNYQTRFTVLYTNQFMAGTGWHSYALVRDTSVGEYRLYVDRTLIDVQPIPDTTVINGSGVCLNIGAQMHDTGSVPYRDMFFAGDICEVRLVDAVVPVQNLLLPEQTILADEVEFSPPMEFEMGSPVDEYDRDEGVETQHTVHLSRNLIAKTTEVTQAEYEAVMGNNPSFNPGCPNCPVEGVSWFDALEYCNALSQTDGLTQAYSYDGEAWTWDTTADGWRLPTEAEWEFLCRAGTTTPFNTGSCLNADTEANYRGEYPYSTCDIGTYWGSTIPVASFPANAFGLYDMHGNVGEWCWDSWDGTSDYEVGPVYDPAGDTGSRRSIRGGDWGHHGKDCRAAKRLHNDPATEANATGFRVVRSLYTIALLSPNGGETYIGNQQATISWNEAGATDVVVELSYDNGQTWEQPPLYSGPSLGSFTWTVPETDSDQCRIRVSDASDPESYDGNDEVFSIVSRASIMADAVAYWSFDVDDADDLTGTFPLANSAEHQVVGPAVGDGCYAFDGTARIEYDPTRLELGNDFTYAMWFKRTSSSMDTEYLLSISTGNESIYDGLRIATWGTGDAGYMYGYDSGTTHIPWISASGLSIHDGAWHQIVLTKSSGTAGDDPGGKLYIDGQAVTTDSYAAGLSDAVASDLRFNPTSLAFLGDANAGSIELEGGVDEFGVWNRVLSAEEISALWNAGQGCNPLPPLIVQQPNVGTVLVAGETTTVVWRSGGPLTGVNIEYSANDGADWNLIDSVPDLGSCSWTVPANPGAHYTVRTSATDNPDISSTSSTFKVVSEPDILAHYAFTDGSYDDISGNENHLEQADPDRQPTLIDGFEYSPAEAFAFDTNDYLAVTDPTDITPVNESMTFAAWVRLPAASDTYLPLLSLVDEGTNTNHILLERARQDSYSGKMLFEVKTSINSFWVTSTMDGPDFEAAGWVHVTGVIDAENSLLKMYINGMFDTESTYEGTFDFSVLSNLRLDVGYYSIGNTYLNSDLDDVRIYRRALSDAEILAIGQRPIEITSPVAGDTYIGGQFVDIQFDLNATIGSVAVDVSTDNGVTWTEIASGDPADTYIWNVPELDLAQCRVRVRDAADSTVYGLLNGTFSVLSRAALLTDAVAYYPFDHGADDAIGSNHGTTSANIQLTTTQQMVGTGAYEFDGIDDHIETGQIWTTAASFSISYWVYPTDNGPTQIHLAQGFDDAYDDRSLAIHFPYGSSDQIAFCLTGTAGGWDGQARSSSGPVYNQWNHVVFTRDAGDYHYYLNGTEQTLVMDSSHAGLLRTPTNNVGRIGHGTDTAADDEDFAGMMDEVGFWERALCASDISGLYNRGQGYNPVRTITVTSPNGGESYLTGGMISTTWVSSYPIDEVIVEYSIDNGGSWTTIPTTGNPGTVDWTAPDATSVACLVRVTDASDVAVFDTSDATFTIEVPAGNIDVQITPAELAADWSIAGPSDPIAGAGSLATPLSDLPLGDYTITWGGVAGWEPDQAQDTQTLTHGNTIPFAATYTMQPPRIMSIDDIPEDQGGWVRLTFERCGDDMVVGDWPEYSVTGYTVFREVADPELKGQILSDGQPVVLAKDQDSLKLNGTTWPIPAAKAGAYRIFDGRLYNLSGESVAKTGDKAWEAVATLFAMQQNSYQVAAPTLADSIAGQTPVETCYKVTAHTTRPSIFHEGPSACGYSTDDIAPESPTGLAGGYTYDGTQTATFAMTWDLSTANDFDHFVVYRGASWAEADSVDATIDPSWSESVELGSTSEYWVVAVDYAGNKSDHIAPSALSGVEADVLPTRTALLPNYPNPFNPSTTISFEMKKAALVRINIYTLDGRLAAKLIDTEFPAGRHRLTWNGRDDRGSRVASGTYFCRFECGDFAQTNRMTLLK